MTQKKQNWFNSSISAIAQFELQFKLQFELQIVFIDPGVTNYQTLANSVVPDTEIIILDPNRDGIEQISEVLSQKSYSTVHLVSHGSPGCLYLGKTKLNLDTLDIYTQNLKIWFSSSFLPPRSSLLIYGCNVAAGDAGEEFITKLHSLTGAEIAASTTPIGNAAKGGNWNLDYQTSKFTPQLVFNQNTKQNYAGIFEEEDKNPLVSDLAENLSTEITADITSVTTDKDDYPPGATATITGENFEPGETVELQVLHTDDVPNTGGGHDPWQVTDGGAGDLDGVVDGNIETTWYVNPDDSANSAFELTATGLSSGEVATHDFTDAVLTIFSDNFDGTAKSWIPSTATSGQWAIGNPVGYSNGTAPNNRISQLENANSSPNALITGLTGVNTDDVDGTVTVQSPNFVIPATPGTINVSLQYYFTSYTPATNPDIFKAEIVEVGNTTNRWLIGQEIEPVSTNPPNDAAWIPMTNSVIVTPSFAFAGKTVYLEFTAQDATADDTTEAGVDDVNVTFTELGDVFGTVFNDYNNNGTQQLSNDAAEVGVSGITVKAYNAAGTVVATATTDTYGYYGLNTSGVPVRVEFTNLPTGFVGTALGGNSSSPVAFTTGSSKQIDFGIHRPSDVTTGSLADIDLITPCYVYGAGTASDAAIVLHDYNDAGSSTSTPVAPAHTILTTYDKVGTVGGLAYHRQSNSTFAGALYKRHSGLGPGGTGAIYLVNNTTKAVTTFATLNAGTDVHDTTNWQLDAASYDVVGKRGLGDVELSEDGKTLWTVNLFDKRLYKMPVGNTSTPLTPTPPAAGNIQSFDIISQIISSGGNLGLNATANVRPFALSVRDGKVYVGMVNTAEFNASGQAGTPNGVGGTDDTTSASDLKAFVYTFDPNNPTAAPVKILDIPLNYARDQVTGGSTGTAANWHPWTSSYPTDTIGVNGGEKAYTQPILSDLDFDANGNILLGFRDRWGDQIGDNTFSPTDITGERTYNNTTGSGVTTTAGNTITKNFIVNDNITISDVSLGLDASHTWRGNLQVILESPNGTRRTIIASNFSDSFDNYDVLLQDSSTGTINDGNNDTANDTGFERTAKPSNPLSAFAGQSSLGTWKLEITNLNTNTTSGAVNLIYRSSQLRINGTGKNNIRANSGGDLLRATLNQSTGVYTIEPHVTTDGTTGANNKDGEFFNREFLEEGNTSDNTEFHAETAQGSTTVVPGVNQVATIALDPTKAFSGGFEFFNTTDGSFAGHAVTETPLFPPVGSTVISPITAHGLEIFSTPTTGGGSFFGKANGLGDVEFATEAAPVQIGNRVWYDANNDGLQTAGEAGVIPNGVVVQLYNSSGTLVTSTTTTNGEYYFSNLTPFTNYEVRLAASNFQSGGLLYAYELGTKDAGSNANDTIDSDAILSSGVPVIAFTTGASGENNFTYDFGLIAYDYGDAPDTLAGSASGDYTTTKANGGASHVIVTGLSIGSNLDKDDGTLQNTAATADDLNGIDDEDGISSFSTLRTDASSYSTTVSVTNTTGIAATLVGWIDFNQDGIFQATEAATATVANNATSAILNWSSIPSNIKAGTTYARFRLSTDTAFNTIEDSDSIGALGNGEVEDYQLIVTGIDYGDAPDTGAGTGAGNYQTLKTDNGASHTIVTGLSIGTAPDADLGTLQNTAATADNLNNTNDENGITLTTLRTDASSYSTTVSVTNTTGTTAKLVGWIDFNGDGIFQATEAATATVANNATSAVLNWSSIPTNIKAGTTYARFRLSTDAAFNTIEDSDSIGALGNGEVEDYQLTVTGVDYGDAPDTGAGTGAGNYQTLKTDNGASHTIVTGLSIGTAPDADLGTLQDGTATADNLNNTNDENGITLTTLRTDASSYSTTVSVTNTTGTTATLVGWIDFNQDGIFQATEAATATVANNATSAILNWNTIPTNVKAGTTYARFRLSTDSLLTTSYSTGALSSGEVEDYQLTVTGVDYGDAPDTGAGTGAGNYETTNKTGTANDGASHTIVTGLSIGSTVDGDTGILQNITATADDTTNNGATDDEDGISSFPTLSSGASSYTINNISITNTSGNLTTLIGWIDFDRDGIFEATEAAITPISTLLGNNTSASLTWSSLLGKVTGGNTYARFRLSTDFNGVNIASITDALSIGAASNGEVEDYQFFIQGGRDYGDAPDGTSGNGAGDYTTTSANSGASHTIVSGLSIGSNIDEDSGTLNNTAATADDSDGNDDEDGITSFNLLSTDNGTYSVTVNVNNTTGTAANLLGWIDFNQDGIFQTTEAASSIQTVAANSGATTQTLTWSSIPTNIKAGTTYARFRLSTDTLTTSSSIGALGNGEVEDYQLTVTGVDYGDAPDTGAGTGAGNYQTLKTDNGASHTIVSGLSIGTAPDADLGTLQDATATADDNNGTDDEDGISSFSTLRTDANSYSTTVSVTNTTGTTATLVGWIDFNQDGIFQATEAATATVANNATSATLNWSSIPTNIKAGTTYARFRLSTDTAFNTIEDSDSIGALGNGEVEDYQVDIKNAVTGTNSAEVINTTTTIATTAGSDLITGNKGEDTLTGGGGNDCYYFNETSDGVDTITDFVPGEDKIDISTILATEVTNYTSGNPFTQGYVELIEFNHPTFGVSTIVQIDFDAGDESNPNDLYHKDLVFLRGVEVADLNTTRDFII